VPVCCVDWLTGRIFTLLQNWSCSLPARASRKPSIIRKPKRQKELAGIRNIPGCRLLNWTEPEYPKTCCRFDPPVLFISAAIRKS
jgi:hypothetical protein